MNFGFSEEQELLRAEVRKFLDQNASLERVREIAEQEDGPSTDPALWARMAELGLQRPLVTMQHNFIQQV